MQKRRCLDKCVTWRTRGILPPSFSATCIEYSEWTQRIGYVAREEERKNLVFIANYVRMENWNSGQQEEEELPREVFEVEGFGLL